MWHLPENDTYFKKILEQTPEGFEIDHLEYALKHVKKFDRAIDGGAHVGTWTVRMLQCFKHVIAFEAVYKTYCCLKANVEERKQPGWGKASCLNAAIGPANGFCYIVEDPTRVGNTGSTMVEPVPRGQSTTVDVPMLAIDSWQLTTLDFLKLDVEGFELHALIGAEKTLKVCKPTVMIECKKFTPPRHGGPEVAVKFLTDMGYVGVGGIRNDQVFVHGS